MRSQLELSAGKLQPGNAGYWTHLSSCSDEKMNTRFGTPRAKAQLWAALVPSTRHGLRQSGSSQNSQNYFTEMLFIFNCLSRVINLKSLFYTGLFHVFGVHSIIVHLFSQKPVCLAGLLFLAPAVWSEQGRVVGAGRQQQLRGSSHTTTFYTSHLFEMPTIRRIKSVLHASQQQ